MEGNNLKAVPPEDAFGPLPSLLSLRLDLNPELGTVGPFAFRGLGRLSRLGLRGCGLTTSNLSADAFAGLPRLLSLDVSSNRLTTVPTTPLSHLSSLEALQLGGNPIQVLGANCLKGLGNLRRLDFSNSTALVKVESQAFAAAKSISLLIFDRCPRLRNFGAAAFGGLQTRLSFRESDWTSVPREVFRPGTGVVSIDVAENPITCDCNALPLLERLRREGDSFGNNSFVLCLYPEELRGVELADVEDGPGTVSWATACLSDQELEISGQPDSLTSRDSTSIAWRRTRSLGLCRREASPTAPRLPPHPPPPPMTLRAGRRVAGPARTTSASC